MSGIVGTSHSKSKVIGRSQDTAKAWVNLDGTGTPAANQSFNVDCIGDSHPGLFTVNFIVPMSSTTYCVTTSSTLSYNTGAHSLATGSFVIRNTDTDGTNVDINPICAVVYEN
jgi:hypothetical protein